MLKKINLSENFKKITYKLSTDVALILIIFFVLALLAETVLPGIVSGRRGFEIVVFLLALDVVLNVYLAKELGLTFGDEKKKKAIYVLLFLGLLMLVSSLVKFGLILASLIVIFSVVVLYFLFKIFFKSF